MSEPGTPLPWERSGLHFGQRGQEWIGSVDAYHWSTLEEHQRAGKDAAYIVEACNNFPEAIKLLRDCYIAGHRNGWEDGPTNQEVFDRVAMFMHFHDSEWWKQQQWESEGE